MKPFKKILVTVDFSESSIEAIEVAKSVAARFDAQLCLFNVVDTVPLLAFHTVDLNSETVFRDAEEKAFAELRNLRNGKLVGYGNIELAVRRGEAYKEIVKYANGNDIDLIVMATHGRTGLAHILLGSVAEKVIQHSSVPVLTVKPRAMHSPADTRIQSEEELHLHA